jgi:hypothetical protein
MANNSTWRYLAIYYNNKSLHAGAVIFGRSLYRFSNLLFNINFSCFSKPVNGSWGILKLHALHVHRARSPTVQEW